jgi:hypothetical protein
MNREEDEKCQGTAVASGKLRPEVRLLSHQLQRSIPGGYAGDLRQSLVKGTMDFYDGFKAKDRMETLLIRHIVILNNLATECLERGMNTGKPEARAIDLRSGLKAISLMTELIKMLERRRQHGQQKANGAANVSTLPNVDSLSDGEHATDPGAVGAEETTEAGGKKKPKAA